MVQQKPGSNPSPVGPMLDEGTGGLGSAEALLWALIFEFHFVSWPIGAGTWPTSLWGARPGILGSRFPRAALLSAFGIDGFCPDSASGSRVALKILVSFLSRNLIRKVLLKVHGAD